MTDTVAISTQGLQIGYRNHPVLSELNLELRCGQFTALLGSNGRGKSTLLKTLARTLPPLQGDIQINGKLIQELSSKDFARCLAIVNTDRVSASLSVEEIISMGRQPHTGFLGHLNSHDIEAVEIAMEQTGTESLRKRKITSVSDGERQKVMIARALAQETDIILLDEPTSYLDAASRIETLKLLKSLAAQGKAILMSTHDITEALKACSHAWLITEQGVVAGEVNSLVSEGEIDKIFPGRGLKFDKTTLSFSF